MPIASLVSGLVDVCYYKLTQTYFIVSNMNRNNIYQMLISYFYLLIKYFILKKSMYYVNANKSRTIEYWINYTLKLFKAKAKILQTSRICCLFLEFIHVMSVCIINVCA